MTRLGLRGAAIVTSVTLTLGGVALLGPPAGADTPTATSMSIRAGKAAVKPGGSVVISGSLRAAGEAAAGEVVTLEAKPASSEEFVPIGTDATGPEGGAALTVHPAEVTRYRWTFAGDTALAPSVSGVVRVGIHQPDNPRTRLPTSLSVRLKQGAEAQVVAGSLRSRGYAVRNKRVLLLAKPTGAESWQFRRGHRTNDNGRVAFKVRPARATRFRLVFLGTPNFQGSRSGTVLASAVAPAPTSLTIHARAVEAGLVVSGTLRGNGHTLKDRRVVLEKLAPGGTTWVESGRKRTDRNGGVRFVRDVKAGTQFRLVFGGSYRFAASTSVVVTA